MLSSPSSIRRPLAGALMALLALPFGCDGGATGMGGQGGGGDGGASGTGGDGGDGGGAFAPAKHSAPPKVVSTGGPVLLFPRVKAVYYADDPDTNAELDTFMDKLADSSFWSKLSAEYGFGPLSVGQSIQRA